MSDQNTEQPYPSHGPTSDGAEPVGTPGTVPEGVEAKFPVTPGTETPEERHEIAEEQRAKIADERSTSSDDEDDEPELSDESDDDEPVLPADDSPIHGESTIEQGSTDPTL